LRAFENKIDAQVRPIASDLGQEWLAIVRHIKLLAGEAIITE
jgi:hypothetical protein